MIVGIEKSQVPFAWLDWGDVQTIIYVPNEIFIQVHESILARSKESPLHIQPGAQKIHPQISHSADLGNYQTSVAAGKVKIEIKPPTHHPLTNGRVFLKIKALVLHWDLNPAIFAPQTHNLEFTIYVCLTTKLIVKEDPTLHVSWSLEEPRSSC